MLVTLQPTGYNKIQKTLYQGIHKDMGEKNITGCRIEKNITNFLLIPCDFRGHKPPAAGQWFAVKCLTLSYSGFITQSIFLSARNCLSVQDVYLHLQIQSSPFFTLLCVLEADLRKLRQWHPSPSGFQQNSTNGAHWLKKAAGK